MSASPPGADLDVGVAEGPALTRPRLLINYATAIFSRHRRSKLEHLILDQGVAGSDPARRTDLLKLNPFVV